jgi:hypothetical protein
MISVVRACNSLFRLGVLYDVKSPKTKPYDHPSVWYAFSETKYLVSFSWDLVAYKLSLTTESTGALGLLC